MNTGRMLASRFPKIDENWPIRTNSFWVWARYFAPAFLIAAFWSRQWLGWWSFWWAAIALAFMWTKLKVVDFPQSPPTWSAKTTLGEHIFLRRKQIPLPKTHHGPIHIVLWFIVILGLSIALWAGYYYQFWELCWGVSLYSLGLTWWLDRMVWLFEDMKELHDEFITWNQ